jgi:small subunit ribosomal protein S17
MARTREPKEAKQPAAAAAPAASTAPAALAPTTAPEAPAAAQAGAAPVAPAAAPAAAAGSAVAPARRRQVKVGRVVSNKMEKTVIVTVENTTTHRLYHRYMKKTSKFAAHDADSRCRIGDVVEIVASRPLSRTKRWRVREILKRAE